MTVAELIAELKAMPQDMEVCIMISAGYDNHSNEVLSVETKRNWDWRTNSYTDQKHVQIS